MHWMHPFLILTATGVATDDYLLVVVGGGGG